MTSLSPFPPDGEGDKGDSGSSRSDSGDLGCARPPAPPPGPAPGCGVVPSLDAVLRSCGEPTLLSAYLQFWAPTLVWVRGAMPPPRDVW